MAAAIQVMALAVPLHPGEGFCVSGETVPGPFTRVKARLQKGRKFGQGKWEKKGRGGEKRRIDRRVDMLLVDR